MVELMGTGYVVDYCISRYKHDQEEKLFRAYVTDALMHAVNNLAYAFGGSQITMSYKDILKPQDTRSGDDIAVDVMQRAGLTLGG